MFLRIRYFFVHCTQEALYYILYVNKSVGQNIELKIVKLLFRKKIQFLLYAF